MLMMAEGIIPLDDGHRGVTCDQHHSHLTGAGSTRAAAATPRRFATLS
jgi:hypothetical protein